MTKKIITTILLIFITYSIENSFAKTYTNSKTFNIFINMADNLSASIDPITINDAIAGSLIDISHPIYLSQDMQREISCSISNNVITLSNMNGNNFSLDISINNLCNNINILGAIPTSIKASSTYTGSIDLYFSYAPAIHN